MRADDKIDPTLDSPIKGADPEPPTLLLTAETVIRTRSDNPQALTLVAGTAVAVSDSDPERIAFNLWNEGRVDEAIEFLEREIAAERDRAKTPSRRKLSRARRKILGDAKDTITAANPQVSERRRQRLQGLASADFSATGEPIGERARELLAVPADQIVPLPPPRRIWPLALGLCLVTAIGLAAAMYLYNPQDKRAALVTPADPTADEPAETASISPAPTATEAKDADTDAAEAVDIPPPEDEAADADSPPVEDIVDEPPIPAAAGTTGAATAPTISDDRREADDSAAPPEEEIAALPDAGASDANSADDAAAPPVVDVRLPRQRPEPPPEAVRAARAAPAVHDNAEADDAAPEGEPDVPLVLGAPPTTLQPPRGAVEPPIYAPSVADPYYGPPRRTTLSPEEYQTLLERREMAEEYLAERRAEADDRHEYRILGRVIPRWRRLGF